MRLRRLELVFIGVTLAFAVFMGGFFTGRSWSSVYIAPTASYDSQTQENSKLFVQSHGHPTEESLVSSAAPPLESTGSSENKQSEISQEPTANTEPSVQLDTGAPRGGDGRININIATQSELTDLPGIGSVLASRIIDYRKQNGSFVRVEDIRNVSGIGEKRYEAIQDKITVG